MLKDYLGIGLNDVCYESDFTCFSLTCLLGSLTSPPTGSPLYLWAQPCFERVWAQCQRLRDLTSLVLSAQLHSTDLRFEILLSGTFCFLLLLLIAAMSFALS